MPPSIAIASPVLGGPGTMRVVLNSSSSRSSWIEAPVLGGPESVRVCVSQAKFSFRHRGHRTDSQAKFSFRHPRTPDRFTAATAGLSMYSFRHRECVSTQRERNALSLSVCALPFMAQLPHGWSSRRPRSPAPAHDIGLLWPIPDPPMQPNLAAMPQDHGRIQVEGE